ncbi:Beta-lactamase [Streptoalloteichus tenebrarius]|uniref:Beta-lactamase n=1 Tax=Streptoalloteichus tenebrarius (strain ATCC 17920 / DSM 40477 / JCM 4838 / CBS 697.72 / NBRC 16177 / NCIMB 11028 / NRRL B-12390 / A12253. 1 / ISP 5477) TaxID=1933 RepID=A0ABT1HPR5_STRSD|nr:Beta-lactamase [Streptoalloteichus tenebrarius]
MRRTSGAAPRSPGRASGKAREHRESSAADTTRTPPGRRQQGGPSPLPRTATSGTLPGRESSCPQRHRRPTLTPVKRAERRLAVRRSAPCSTRAGPHRPRSAGTRVPAGRPLALHTGADVLGLLVAGVTGQTFGSYLQDRLCTPLGMTDSGFWCPRRTSTGCPPATPTARASERSPCTTPAGGGRHSRSQPLELGGSGLVSTADDYLAFCRMLLAGVVGTDGTHVLSRQSVELMTTDQLTPSRREKTRSPTCSATTAGSVSAWVCGPAAGVSPTSASSAGTAAWAP